MAKYAQRLALLCLLIMVANNSIAYQPPPRITLEVKNVTLQQVFDEIKKQTGLIVFYSSTHLNARQRVTLTIKDEDLDKVMKTLLKDKPLGYEIDQKYIVIKPKEEKSLQEVSPVMETANLQTAATPPPPINIRGRIINENGEPVRVTVTVKGTNNATSTNDNGEYELRNVNDKATLVVSGVSIEEKEVKVNGAELLNITVRNTAREEEEVVVAYNKVSAKSLTGSVTVVRGEQIQHLPNRSFDKSLQGFVPGLMVTPGTGLPGGGNSNFILRGVTTNASPINFSTLRNPLIIVDGVPVTQETMQISSNRVFNADVALTNPLSHINPSDIESVSVLKDAAAVALYGAKSANGVIIVTTKRGKAGKTQFNFRSQTDFASLPKQPAMLNQQEYLSLLYETYRNSNPAITDAAILADLKGKFPTRSDGSFYPMPDWIDELYTKNATTLSNEIGMSGGTERTTYYMNLEWTKQNGILRNTGYDRKSLRLNFEHRPVSWLKLGINTGVSYNVQDYGGGTINSVLSSGGSAILQLSPLNPIRLENGDYQFNFSQGGISTNLTNPAAANDYNRYTNTAFRGINRLYMEVDFLRNVKFTSNLGADFMLAESYEKADTRLRDELLTTGGRIEEQDNRRTQFINTNLLTYSKTFERSHQLMLLAGHEAQVITNRLLDLAITGLTSPYYDQINSPGATVNRRSGYRLKETLLSYFGQASYNYANKYYLSATIRRDGSSRFGEDKRFGTYWSAGLGWIVTSEDFMKGVRPWISYLKLRGSIGAAGNAGPIDRFTPYDKLQAGTYLGGVSVFPGSSTAGNADVKWERNENWDIGLELRLFKNRFSLTTDLYQRTTYDLIYSLPLATNTGFSTILGNLGKMRNAGIEFSIATDLITMKSFTWNLKANWAKNKNTLLKTNSPLPATEQAIVANQEGREFNSYYLRVWAGVDPATGSGTWIDSTGKPNSNYDAAKPAFVGKTQPDGFGSVINRFTYQNIELSFMIYYEYGKKIYDNNRLATNDGNLPYANQGKAALDRWQKPGDLAANPKRLFNNPNSAAGYYSTRFLFEGDFIQLQNVSLGYHLPNSLAGKLRLTRLRIFVQGNNLAIWTKGSGKDRNPSEANAYGMLGYSYPIQRTYSAGINTSF